MEYDLRSSGEETEEESLPNNKDEANNNVGEMPSLDREADFFLPRFNNRIVF